MGWHEVDLESNRDNLSAIMLLVEYWSLRLLLELCCECDLLTLSATSSHIDQENGMLVRQGGQHGLAQRLKLALSLPIYRRRNAKREGITEAQCRSLLPAWSLMEFERQKDFQSAEQ